MLKITESAGGQTKSTLFTEETLIVGDSKGMGVHIPLSGRGLKDEHVKIFKQNGEWWVQNSANDPFVTLNHQPFFKKKARSGDSLKVRDVELKLEEIASAQEALYEKPPLEKVATQESSREPSPLTKAPLEPSSNDSQDQEEVFLAPAKGGKESFSRPSLKDFDLSLDKESYDGDFDKKGADKEEAHKEESHRNWSEHLNVSPFRSIRLFSFLLMGFLLITTVVGMELYLRASERNERHELKAAESISDIAMALTYAQLYHISPLKHNWSDPEFIQNNLLATLPTGSPSDLKLNCQGEFGNCDYILRVYTSNDLSHFLVVAHPTPSLIQWLIPRSALIVDSNIMEIRRITNLKALNRQLAILNTLDGANVTQISELVKQGEIIPLHKLAAAVKKPEFAPPSTLAFLRPGAENYIYNAPRYHPFGDALLKKAEHFSSIHTSSHELAMFQSELEMLNRLSNLVLYTTDSTESGKFALAGLKKIAPDKKYILASIRYDSQGRFRSTKIILDSDHPEKALPALAIAPKRPGVAETVEFKLWPEFPSEADIAMGDIVPQDEEEEKHPLQKRLEAMAQKRMRALAKLESHLLKSVQLYLKSGNQKKFYEKVELLKSKKEHFENRLKEDLFDLSLDFEEVDPKTRLEWTQKAGLKPLYEEVLHERE